MAVPEIGPAWLLFWKRLSRTTVGLPLGLLASDRPAMLFWMMLFSMVDPDVPAPRTTPKPRSLALVAPWMVKPSMVTPLAVTSNGVSPLLVVPSTIDSAVRDALVPLTPWLAPWRVSGLLIVTFSA